MRKSDSKIKEMNVKKLIAVVVLFIGAALAVGAQTPTPPPPKPCHNLKCKTHHGKGQTQRICAPCNDIFCW